MKTSGGLCPTRALHVKHKNLKKSIKNQRKVVTRSRPLLKGRTLQNS